MKMMMAAGAAAVAILAGAPALAQRGPMGPVTKDAYLAMQKERFATMDSNKDGVVTKDELTAQLAARMGDSSPPPQMVDAMFERLDANEDGKITAAEVEAIETARFDEMDTDKDGTLTPEERRAGFGGMRRQ